MWDAIKRDKAKRTTPGVAYAVVALQIYSSQHRANYYSFRTNYCEVP